MKNLSSINKTAYFTFTNRVSESNQRIVGLNLKFFFFFKTLIPLKEVLSFAPAGFPAMEMINDYLSDFKIILPIQGYELETSKKVNLEKLRKIT